LADLPGRVRAACEAAAMVGQESTELAEVEPVEADRPAELQRDWRGVSMDEKVKLLSRYNDILLSAGEKIETSRAIYSDGFRTVHFANTTGTAYREERPRLVLALLATARDGQLVQSAMETGAYTQSYDEVVGLEDEAQAASRRAAALLTAPQPEGGAHSVVLNPKMAGVFVHEAFGHLSEADFLYENPRMREQMHIGREIGVKQLNVVDDGSMAGMLGTQGFDDEGTPTGTTYLIREGVLSGHLHSRETAAKMGEKPTGNARAINRRHQPIVRMTNTYIEGGDTPVADLFKGVDDGIYACDMFGGQTQMEQFTFSAAYGYRIRNGEVAELLRDVVLTGNVFETLNAIDGFGDDPQVLKAAGGCGKGGQAPLPVSFGSPHIRIQDVVIAGR
ncbi:MAG: TldD/PmbA family protein, partial [Planctomycetota bacterium]